MRLDSFFDSPGLKQLYDDFAFKRSYLFEGLWNSPKALIASLALKATSKHILIITGAAQEEYSLFNDFPYFTEASVIDFPAWETLPNENISPSPDIVGERYLALHQLTQDERPRIMIAGLQSVLQKVLPPKKLQSLFLQLRCGEDFPFELLVEMLIEMGYERCSVAVDKGQFAVRGGIIDLFPVSSPDPYRIEFWGDEIDSIRCYDPVGQKSIEKRSQIEVPPAKELELIKGAKDLGTIFDYLGEETLVIFDDLLALEDRYATFSGLLQKDSSLLMTMEELLNASKKYPACYFTSQPIEELSQVEYERRGTQEGFYSKTAPSLKLSFQMFGQKIEASKRFLPFQTVARYLYPDDESLSGEELLFLLGNLASDKAKVRLICSNENEVQSFKNKFEEHSIKLPPSAGFETGYLSSGLVITDSELVLLPTPEITQRYKLRRQKQRSTYHTPPTEIFELSPGDHVVHLNQGIGRFRGIERRKNIVGVETEFFQIDYAENGSLFVPIHQAHLLTKYVGAHDEKPKLHKLGEARWKKTREKTEREIMGYAADLLQLYARREAHGGYAFPSDSKETLAFDETFPYHPTEDQIRAIAEIKADMLSERAMDRLICGDVGYGKTEVAMRAAFKAVIDGSKQVAILVPTTMLAMQHYENFLERMEHYGVNVGVLSRFVSSKKVKETLEGVAEGSVDIIVGTHRIISKDVAFKNLGLIVIDEEQRFGVRAKEHLKKVKEGVDCLTLSATPIPRTLYMSMIGARDMSVISTPPQDRLPIKSILADDEDETIKTALLRELMRDGQAFIIHNRVETIFEYASRIQKLLPQARIVVGHGQMHSDEIDTVFHTFKSGKADILISTTIIENGIDIPNANTIIIDRADRFGLAELYQLRGRVGRWNRRAYAYFVVPRKCSLPEVSLKRLNALMETSGYGGGMKIAMRDLEIRGAGSLLGVEQSGHVATVGFHLYCKMLKRAIKSIKGEIPSLLCDARVELPIDARLPEEYVDEVSLRMEFYQRFGEAVSFEDVEALLAELKDRFGPPPQEVIALYYLSRIRVFASRHGIQLVKIEKVSLSSEQMRGGKLKSCKSLFKTPKDPAEIEKEVIEILRRQFEI